MLSMKYWYKLTSFKVIVAMWVNCYHFLYQNADRIFVAQGIDLYNLTLKLTLI